MIDWTLPAHVLQVIYWTVLFAVAMHGYSFGSRSAI